MKAEGALQSVALDENPEKKWIFSTFEVPILSGALPRAFAVHIQLYLV